MKIFDTKKIFFGQNDSILNSAIFFTFLLHKAHLVHTRGIQLIAVLLLLAPDTLHTKCRHLDICMKILEFLTKLQHFELSIIFSFFFFRMDFVFSDAYRENSTCSRAFDVSI